MLKKRLQAHSLPLWWIALVLRAADPAARMPVVTGLEVFSGNANLGKGFAQCVGPTLTFEVLDNIEEDCMHETGIVKLLTYVLSIMIEGWCWLGTPCSSWIILSRSFTQRSIVQPSGPTTWKSRKQHDYVKKHNDIATISALVYKTCVILGIAVAVEQPRSSLLWRFPPVKEALEMAPLHTIPFFMSSFGHTSQKPLIVKGSGAYLDVVREVAVRRPKTEATQELVKYQGARFTGCRAALTESSSYRRAFGFAVALAFVGKNADEILHMLHASNL